MKARLFVIELFLFVLVACNPSMQVPEPVEGPSPELSAVDSLMWHQPDSALTCLLPYFDTCCRDALNASPDTTRRNHCVSTTAYNRHYANLLLSELLYKNDYAQVNRAELLQAVAYFDSLVVVDDADTRGVSQQARPRRDARRASAQNIAFLDARAHYINGVGYYENDSVVEACAEYLKTLEVMENHFEEKKLIGHKAQFMALTYTRLTVLFSDLYLHEQAIYFGKESLVYYDKYNTSSWHLAWMLNEIGSHYDMMSNYDDAEYYYRKSLMALLDTNNLTYRDISTRLAFLSYNTGGVPLNSINQLQTLIGQSDTKTEALSRCAIVGEIYFHEKQFDSAWIYLNKVFQESQSVDSKKQVAERLVEICRVQGRITEMHVFAEFLVPFATQEENKSEIKSQLTELYKAFGQSQQERQHRKEIRRHRNHSMAVIAGLVLVILLILALYHNNKHRKQHLENQINEEKQVHSIEKKALASRLKNSNETLRELQNQIKQQNKNISIKTETQATTFMDEPICRLIMERVHAGQFKSQINCSIYKDYALSKEQLVALQDAANQHFDRFTVRLAQAYPDITKSDINYCCLHLLGLNDADMSALMQRAYNTINERNSKLRKILGCKNSISIALKAFANNRA